MAVSKNSVNDTDNENISNESNGTILEILLKLQKEMDELKAENQKLKDNAKEILSTEQISKNLTDDDEITIIMNFNGRLDIPLPDLELVMTKFGEERQVNKQQFQTLIGKYRSFFEKQMILLGSKHLNLADRYKVVAYDPNSRSFMHPSDLNNLGKLPYNELENYYNNLSEASKVGFLSYWYSKCYERNKDYYDISKMELLNRLSKSKTFNVMIRELTSIEEKYPNK